MLPSNQTSLAGASAGCFQSIYSFAFAMACHIQTHCCGDATSRLVLALTDCWTQTERFPIKPHFLDFLTLRHFVDAVIKDKETFLQFWC